MGSLGSELNRYLAALGVRTVFGIPGVHNVELFRGIRAAGIEPVLPRHEQGAGFMADGYARATGRPGVAFAISGPGLTNLMTPLGQAYSDSQPLLAISATLDRADLRMGRGRLHEMRDQRAAAETVCAWSETAMDACAAFELVDRAFAGFASARPRPVHIQIPMDVLAAPAEAPAPPDPAAPPSPPPPDPRIVAAAARTLLRARRPLILVGGGAAGASQAVRRLSALLRAPVFATVAGKGVADDGSGFAIGALLPRPESAEALGRADATLLLGTELAPTDFWRDETGLCGELIRVDLDPDALSRPRAGLRAQCDAAAFAATLAAALADAAAAGGEAASEWTEAEVDTLRERLRALAAAERPGLAAPVAALRRALPEDAILASDMTEIAYLANELFDVARPRSLYHPCGFGALGFALPAAIGACIGAPERPVACLAGDYGLQFTLPEIGVAVERELPIPIVLWDNSSLGEIRRDMVAKSIEPVAVEARNPDFCALARAWGARAAEPADGAAFQTAVAEALAAPGPTLIRLTPETFG